jgi:hypothetical protein
MPERNINSTTVSAGETRMNLETRVYATTQGCDDRDAAVALMRRLGQHIREIAARRPGLGWQVIAFADEEDIEDFDVPTELTDRATGGRLPALNVNLSYDLDVAPAGDPELDTLLDAFGLIHVATLPDDA